MCIIRPDIYWSLQIRRKRKRATKYIEYKHQKLKDEREKGIRHKA
jgi:hypothetical protein